MGWRGRAALGVLGILLGLMLAEGIVRLTHPIPDGDLLPLRYDLGRLRRLGDNSTFIRFDQGLGWTSTPAIKRTSGGITYQHNRAGIRANRDYAPSPPPGVRRIEAFGDSYTYCQDVNGPDCWTSMLEERWPGTEVLNFGVVGYGLDQAWLRFQAEGPAFQPCAVLLGYMIENINRVLVRFRPYYTPDTGIVLSKPRFLLAERPTTVDGVQDGPWTLDGLRLLPNPVTDPRQLTDARWVEQTLGPEDGWFFPGLFVPSPLDVLEAARVVRSAAFRLQHDRLLRETPTVGYSDGREAYLIVQRVLAGFARQVRAQGATPVVLLLSPEDDLNRALRGEPPVYAPLADWLNQQGIPTLDLTDDLVDEARRSGLGAVMGDRTHYRPLGNRVVADALARRLPPLVTDTCDNRQRSPR